MCSVSSQHTYSNAAVHPRVRVANWNSIQFMCCEQTFIHWVRFVVFLATVGVIMEVVVVY